MKRLHVLEIDQSYIAHIPTGTGVSPSEKKFNHGKLYSTTLAAVCFIQVFKTVFMYRFYAQYRLHKPNMTTMQKSQLEFNYLLQPNDVMAANESQQQSSVNGNVFRGSGCSNNVIIQRA